MKYFSVLIKKHQVLTLLTIILAAYFFFGLQHIGSFITADEHYWVEERIPRYFDAWSDLDVRKTDINDKPGVSLSLVSGPALLLHDTTTLDCQEKEGWFSGCDPTETSRIYASFRLPILLVNALFLVLIFFAVRAFTDRNIAIGTVALTALSPHLLGLSQIVNPDSLLWSSGSAAIFAFLAFLRSGKRSFAIWTVAALTMALLSKYAAIMIVFFLPVIVLGSFIIDRSFSPMRPRSQIVSLLVISAAPFLLFALFVPEIFVPAATKFRENYLTAGTDSWLPWLAYIALLLLTAAISLLRIPQKRLVSASRISLVAARAFAGTFLLASVMLVVVRHILPTWDIFTVLPFDIKDITNARYFLGRYLSPLEIAVLELHPLVFALPIATLVFSWFAIGRAVFLPSAHRLSIFLLLGFSLVSLVAFGFSNVLTTPRYISLLFPIFAFFAAIGITEVGAILRKKYGAWAYSVMIVIVALSSIGSAFSSKPFYANFDNIVLPKSSILTHSWGYGGYEAARYLNALSDAKNLTVWSDYYGVCEFFVGRCLTAYTFDPNDVRPDYYVLTRRGQIRYMSRADRWEELSGLVAYRYYDRTNPDWSLEINGQEENFVKVFRLDR